MTSNTAFGEPNSCALVTGVASGLGQATAQRLAAEGIRVVGLDLNPGEAPEHSTYMAVDVTDEDGVMAVLDDIRGGPFPLRYVVNCAGIRSATPIVEGDDVHSLEALRRVLEVNLVGTFNVVRLAAREMARNEPDDDGARGAIVNTASIAAYEGLPGQSAYVASKAALAGMTIGMAREFSDFGVRVNTIAPGVMDSPLIKGLTPERRAQLVSDVVFPKRFGKPSEFADLAFFLLVNAYMNGSVVRLDGALRMAKG